ncbi:inositol oxygenase isoform X2 [Petaurus breviceps papuanus]|uniref:inositol oxygenase isoform X2 n=1 Tax=Petaurus breviceps papuanus TaxID=3040969 RepID=UPI0036D83C5E
MTTLMGPDPSQIYRPEGGKNKEDFRNYTSGPLLDRVFNTYKLMHTYQTVDFVRKKIEEYGRFSYKKMTVMEAVDMLDRLVDESDPDVDFPNSFHAFQTAEGIRKAHPDKDWFHLVGLLHDLGKILVMAGEPQWSVVGDTFPVGCRPQKSVVFCDSTFQDNPDTKDPRYCTEYGMYKPHCGLENVLMSWGHDGETFPLALHCFSKDSSLPQSHRNLQEAPRVHVSNDEVQQILPASGGLLHDSLPLLLPLAYRR